MKSPLKKQLNDAYEEVEEQRQVVGQWKRKAQKMTSEMNDLRMLLEEQNGRNNLLEKKQRKFDSECQALQVRRYYCNTLHSTIYNDHKIYLNFRTPRVKNDKPKIVYRARKTY